MRRTFLAACVLLTCWMLVAQAREPAPAAFGKDARIGLVNLLDPEVAEFHASRALADSFFKTRQVDWSIDTMLNEAVAPRLAALGLTAVPVEPSDPLLRHRDDYFVNHPVAPKLPADLARELVLLAGAQHLDALIVLAPGINKSFQGATRKGPEYLRGWGFISGPKPATASLFNMTQLLLVVVSGQGAVLQAREWGGAFAEDWSGYAPPADPRELPAAQIAQLRAAFGQVLAGQVERLLAGISASP